MIQLDAATLSYSEADGHWRTWEVGGIGQLEIAVMASTDELSPAPWAVEQLARELMKINVLLDAALAAAKEGWSDTYHKPAPEDGWSLERIAVEQDSSVTLSLYEGVIDTYGEWKVAMRDGAALGVKRCQI